jgi:hypothetical protein
MSDLALFALLKETESEFSLSTTLTFKMGIFDNEPENVKDEKPALRGNDLSRQKKSISALYESFGIALDLLSLVSLL